MLQQVEYLLASQMSWSTGSEACQPSSCTHCKLQPRLRPGTWCCSAMWLLLLVLQDTTACDERSEAGLPRPLTPHPAWLHCLQAARRSGSRARQGRLCSGAPQCTRQVSPGPAACSAAGSYGPSGMYGALRCSPARSALAAAPKAAARGALVESQVYWQARRTFSQETLWQCL